ncbi:acetyl-CoA carboxylase, carboxyltransferase subunit beta [Actinomadura sediminis]|uniref:Multifunctional fusion protein n=1 Tax=Actinomadura sediminis TaxID=1038904 RepID=A0ABW3EJF7_9ACTN
MTSAIENTTETPDWVLCPSCGAAVYGKRWERDLRVCADCGAHGPLGARARIEALLDPDGAVPIGEGVRSRDVLGFVDRRPYPDRLADARARTGTDDAVRCVRGTIEGHPVVAAVMDFAFLGGSLGCAVGELITRAAEAALAERVPLLLVTASGGARMQEGAYSLMQMAKTGAAMARLDEAGVLSVCLVTDPTFGGVAASFASLADVIIAEPGARMGFAGRRVIEQTIRQRLPESFQTAEFLFERGFVDIIARRPEQRAVLAGLLALGARPVPGRRTSAPVRRIQAAGRSPGVRRDGGPVVRDAARLAEQDPWDLVRRARSLDRPTALDYFASVFTGFRELHGDRTGGDCPAIVAGTARLDGRPVVVVGTQKGHRPDELARRNFGMATPAGYRKARRVTGLAAKLGLPVVTLVDTPGAYPGAAAEEQGQAAVIAETIRHMTTLPVPVVAVLTGEGGSGGALALATANRVLGLAGATYSVISPEGCAAILWQDPAAAPAAARALGLTPASLLRHGVLDGVVPEPPGGAGADPAAAAERLRAALAETLDELAPLSGDALVADRRDRFRRFGAAETTVPEEAIR